MDHPHPSSPALLPLTDGVPADVAESAASADVAAAPAPKIRLDPTRYGDWELAGKCVDF